MRLGILGAADINAKAVYQPAQEIADVELAGIAARDRSRAEAAAKEAGIERVYETYEELLADPSIDAIYNPLPNGLHFEWTVAALEAGRHVLCEKPLTSNAAQAETAVTTAQKHSRVLMEAFHWRFHPVASRMIGLCKQIGPLHRVEARFNARIPTDNIRYRLDLAGGSFMDLGCYCVHMVRTVVGSEPRVLSASAVEGPKGIDLAMAADISFPDGTAGTVGCSMNAANSVWPDAFVFKASGDNGEVEVKNPMAPQFGHHVHARFSDGTTVDEVLDMRTSYEFQMLSFLRVLAGQEKPITGGQDAIGNMRVIDDVYEASGLGARH